MPVSSGHENGLDSGMGNGTCLPFKVKVIKMYCIQFKVIKMIWIQVKVIKSVCGLRHPGEVNRGTSDDDGSTCCPSRGGDMCPLVLQATQLQGSSRGASLNQVTLDQSRVRTAEHCRKCFYNVFVYLFILF